LPQRVMSDMSSQSGRMYAMSIVGPEIAPIELPQSNGALPSLPLVTARFLVGLRVSRWVPRPHKGRKMIRESKGAAVSVRDVTKTFVTSSGETHAVDSVSFEIPAGSFASIIGPSGCGKTTVARMIGDL